MQMIETGTAVDVVGMPARRSNAGVDRLAALPNQDQVVNGALAKWPKKASPGLRQGEIARAKQRRYRGPGGSIERGARKKVFLSARRPKAPTSHVRFPAFAAACGMP